MDRHPQNRSRSTGTCPAICWGSNFYKHICSVCDSQGKENRHASKDCLVSLPKKQGKHCKIAVPNVNRSYAQVVKQNTQPKLQSQKCTKVMSHPVEISQAKNVLSRWKTTHRRKGQSQLLGEQPCDSSKTKIVRPKMATARKKESFQLPLKNKFSLLSQNLQAINDTETMLMHQSMCPWQTDKLNKRGK